MNGIPAKGRAAILAELVGVATLAGIVLAGCGGSKTISIITVETRTETQTVTSTDATRPGSKTNCATTAASCHQSSGQIYFFALAGVAQDPRVRPSKITFAADGNDTVSGLQWRGWGTRVAGALGTDHVNNCMPSCAQGHIRAVPARVELYQPGRQGGRRMYLCYSVSLPAPEQDLGFCVPPTTAAGRGCNGSFDTAGNPSISDPFWTDIHVLNNTCFVALGVTQDYVKLTNGNPTSLFGKRVDVEASTCTGVLKQGRDNPYGVITCTASGWRVTFRGLS